MLYYTKQRILKHQKKNVKGKLFIVRSMRMQITDKLLKPVIESKYLTVENADRYRSIIRFFYLKYEKLQYWIYQEEVYEELKSHDYFSDYTMEQCQQDLAALVNWKNLIPIQDTKKALTLEEFKNKKYKYQLSEYSVEIERMVIRLENLFIETTSLEPSLLERIRKNIGKIKEMSQKEPDIVYSWWMDLSNDFIRLNQNYQDYMRELNSVKAEEMMKTLQFLAFKDRLTEYLRTFVKSLQMNVTMIEQYLKNLEDTYVHSVLDKVVLYEESIPHVEIDITTEQISENVRGRFESMKEWFLGRNGMASEAYHIFDLTNETIRKITRYATRISELSHRGANRRQEYYKVAEMFGKCSNISEAHKLSAYVFGIEAPLHLKGEFRRATESINSGVYEEEPYIVEVIPRIRQYREKVSRSGIIDRTQEKEKIKQEMLLTLEKERTLFQSYIIDNRLEFSKLPVLEPQVRDTFLMWLSKALENKELCGRTEDGREYYIENGNEKQRCVIKCYDGDFEMPAYTIQFKEKEGL